MVGKTEASVSWTASTDSAENKGYDSGKKVSGIKRHIAVDTQGLPHAIHVTTAKPTVLGLWLCLTGAGPT